MPSTQHVNIKQETVSTEREFMELTRLSDSLAIFGMATLLGLTESWGAYQLATGGLTLQWAIAGHMGLTGLTTAWVFWRRKNHPGERFPLLLMLAMGLLGPLGILGFLLSLCLYVMFRNHPTPMPELYDSIFPKVEKEDMEHLFDQLIAGDNGRFEKNSVVPFMDILKKGTDKQKQAMLILVINHYDPKFAPVLKEALNDDDSSVRVLAATGMSKIDSQFTERNLSLEKMEDGQKNPDHHKNLGLLYDDYVHSGILDDARDSEYSERAIQNYLEHLRYHPEDLAMRLKVNRMLLKSGRVQEAAKGFEESIENGFKTTSMLLWYFECLYRLGQFEKLRQQIAENFDDLVRDKDNFPFDIFDIVNAWAEPKGELPPEKLAEKEKAFTELDKRSTSSTENI